jgi:hypothetical protein
MMSGQRQNPAVKPARLPLDEARLRPHLRARAQQQADVLATEFERAVGEGVEPARPSSTVFKPEAGDLRGLPCLAPGVGGVQPGTDPVSALLAKERRTVEAPAAVECTVCGCGFELSARNARRHRRLGMADVCEHCRRPPVPPDPTRLEAFRQWLGTESPALR